MRDDGERPIRAAQQQKRVALRAGFRVVGTRARVSRAAPGQTQQVIERVDRRSSNVRRRPGLRRDEGSMRLHPQAIAKIARARQKGVEALTSFMIEKRIRAQSYRAPDTSRALALKARRAQSLGGSIENRGIDVLHVGARDRDLGGAFHDAPPFALRLSAASVRDPSVQDPRSL